MSKRYLQTFFKEKALPFAAWEIVSSSGTSHMIDSAVVIEAILHAPAEEQQKIAAIIREIDFKNGDVNHFLKHLAKGVVEGYEEQVESKK
jgi:hypothetical protein